MKNMFNEVERKGEQRNELHLRHILHHNMKVLMMRTFQLALLWRNSMMKMIWMVLPRRKVLKELGTSTRKPHHFFQGPQSSFRVLRVTCNSYSYCGGKHATDVHNMICHLRL